MPDPLKKSSEEAPIAVLPKQAPAHDPVKGKTKPKRQPNYHVIIWNDEEHTYEYVIELLMRLFAHDIESAIQITRHFDRVGKGIAGTYHMELAELKRDQILAYGPDHRMKISKSSIRATIEPAPE